jgi:DNA-directed RNA polymerase beta subunit
MRPEQLEDLKNIAKEIKSLDHVYGSGLMIPFGNKVNSSRAAMTYQQIPQAKNLDNPEIPRVATGYEKVYGDRSTSYYKSEKDFEVIQKIQKFGNDAVYALVLKERGTNFYDIIFRHAVESFAESSGTRINNDIIDSKKIGDKITTGEIIHRSQSYDEDMNYRLGINAKTLYMIDPMIVEDAIRVSDTMAERLSSTSVSTYSIPKNTNDVFLNIYGGNGPYKAFPDIGEKIKDRILCTRRRIDYNSAQYLLKSKNLRKEMFGDVTYYAEGTIVDIDIYSNTPLDELPQDGSHTQVNKYLRMIVDYWKTIHDLLGEIMENTDNTYSDNVGLYFARARDVLSIGKKVKWNTELSVFDNMIINITVAKSGPAIVGSKLVGRHGNKGVIADICPDDEMPRSEDGEYAEIIYDALSIIGRLNPSQLYEQELNWLIDNILAGDASKKKKFETILDLLSICNPDQEKLVKNFYGNLSDKDKKDFLEEITQEFVVFQSASNSITFKNYAKLIDKINPRKKRFTVKSADGKVSKIQRKLIMSDTYVFRLKHEPITKFSARSKGTINPRTFLPIKSHAYSRGTALFNNQAIRLGNMEMDVLQLCNDPAAINYMTRLYCTSVVGRREFHKLLNTDVFSEEIHIDMENSKSRVVDMFTATLLTSGLTLDIEFGDIEEIKDEVMVNISEMSKKNIKVTFKPEYKNKKGLYKQPERVQHEYPEAVLRGFEDGILDE